MMNISIEKCPTYRAPTLGGLIDALEKCDDGAVVHYDFCYLSPTEPSSYRGYYECLSLGWEDDDSGWPTVSELIGWLKAADGETYSGWKGGDFKMDKKTAVWVANAGQTGGTIISKIIDEGSTVILKTKRIDG